MNDITYKNRIFSILNRVEPILIEYGKDAEVSELKTLLSSNISSKEIATVKQDTLILLNQTLTFVQIKFVETEEPTNDEIEMFRKYLVELKDYRQELSTPYSEIRKKVSGIIKSTRTTLNADLSNQAIAFPSEYLDAILRCPEAKEDKSGDWVVAQVNEGLKALSLDVSAKLGACSEAINEILDCEIQTISSGLTSHIYNTSTEASTSDRIFGISRQALPAIGLGGLSTTILSTIVNPFLGLAAGLAVGGSYLFKSVKSTDNQQRFIELKQQLAPKISLAINEMKNSVAEELSNIEEQVNDYVNETCQVIAEEMKDCMDAIKSCENDYHDFYKQQEVLNGQMTCLETYIKQLEILNTNPFETK